MEPSLIGDYNLVTIFKVILIILSQNELISMESHEMVDAIGPKLQGYISGT